MRPTLRSAVVALVSGSLALACLGCGPTTPPGPVSTTIDWPADEPVIGFVPSDWTGSAALVVGPHRWQVVPSPHQSTIDPRQPRTTDTTRTPTAAVTIGQGGAPYLVAANGVPSPIGDGEPLRSPGGIRLLHATVRKDVGHGRTRLVNPAGVAVLDADNVLVATQTSVLGPGTARDAIVYAVGGYLAHPVAGRSGSPTTEPLSGLAAGELADGTDYGVGRVRAMTTFDLVDALMVSDSSVQAGGRPTLDVSLLERSGTIVRGDSDPLCSGPFDPVAVRMGEEDALITVSARAADGTCSSTLTASYLVEIDRSRVTRPVLRINRTGTGTSFAFAVDRENLVHLTRPEAGRLTITWPN